MATNTDVQDLSAGAKLLATVDQKWFKVESAFNLLAAFFIFGIMMLGVVQVIGRSFLINPFEVMSILLKSPSRCLLS